MVVPAIDVIAPRLHLLRRVGAWLCGRQRQYISVIRLDAPAVTTAAPDPDVECMVVDSTAAFSAVAPQMPATFRDTPAELGARVAQGCVLFVARLRRPNGSQVIGYELAERGVFSALGRRVAMPDEVVFGHYVEVLPEHRGRRVHRLLFATRDEYFRRRGCTVLVGVVSPDNVASLRALRRAGAVIVGSVERVQLARTVSVWTTPRARIEQSIRRHAA